MTEPSSNPDSSSGGSDTATSSQERIEFELDSETLNPNRFARRRTDRHGRRADRAGGAADRAGSVRTHSHHTRPCLGTKRLPAKTREVARGRTSFRGRREEKEREEETAGDARWAPATGTNARTVRGRV